MTIVKIDAYCDEHCPTGADCGLKCPRMVIKEVPETTETPQGGVSNSSDWLERTVVINAIDSEPEYPDAEAFKNTMREELIKHFDGDGVEMVIDMIFITARGAVRDTKKGIKERVLAL